MKFMKDWKELKNKVRQILENREILKMPTSDLISVWE